MQIQAVTISVSDLARSKKFYEEILGFEPDVYHEPTRWQSYVCEGRAFFGITEVPGHQRIPSQDIINFIVSDVQAMWERIEGQVQVETTPAMMPWGTFKMVIVDPDGYRLGFIEDQSPTG